MRRRLRQILARIRRISFVGLALLGYLAAAFGFPLPVQPIKDRSVPFPCQDRPCGCRSADECWQSCCCFSREQHLAWAHANQVEPPASFVESGWNEQPKASGDKSACCKKQSDCCAKQGQQGDRDCCSAASTAGQAKPSDHSSSTTSHSWVVGTLNQQCRGLLLSWVQSGAALPAPTPNTMTIENPFLGWLPSRNPVADPLSPSPAVPPPRA